MKTKALVLPLALLLGASLSCDMNPTRAPTTGSISIVLLAPSGAAFSASRSDATSGLVPVDRRASIALDGARVSVSGPTTKTVSSSTPTGGNFQLVVSDLAPGSYTVTVEGLAAGQVAHFGQTAGVSVTAGVSTPASVSFPVFQPGIPAAGEDTMDVLRFTASWTAVANATGYIVQWSQSPTMTNPSSVSVTGATTTDIAVTSEGKYYYTVKAVNAAVTAGGLASAPASVYVFQGVASVSVSPASPTIAFGGSQQFTAEARDADNAVVPNVTWYWASSNHTVATVSQSGLVTAAGSGTVQITAVGKGTPGSAALTVNPAPATRLAFTTQPTHTVAGQPIATARVAVQNDYGQTITSDNTTQITLAIGNNAGSGSLSGTVTATVTAGIATFADLSINRTGSGYTLTAAANALTGATSSGFNITPGSATQLAFLVQPTGAALGDALSPAVQAELRDAHGNRATSAGNEVTIAIGTNPSGGTLAGTTKVNAVSGVASFSGLSIDKAGTGYTLVATATGLTSATSAAFDIGASTAATKLAFTVQPTSGTSNAGIAPAITLAIQDAQGRTVTSDNTTQVTIAIGTNAGGGTLAGTVTVTAAAGVASFSGLSIDRAGSGYTLTATAATLASATSTAFDIAAGAPNRLVFAVQPASSVAGDALSPAVQVEIQDAAGNRVTTARDAVTVAIGTNPPGTGALTGTKVVNAIDGIASFTGLWINKTGTGYTLAATSGSLNNATSSGFDVSPAAPAKLAFAVQPPSTASGNTALAPAFTVQIRDQFDNATTATNNVTVSLSDNPWKSAFATGGSLAGTLTVAAVSGTATFPGLSIDKPGPGYTIGANATGLTGATSSPITVNLSFSQIAAGGLHTCGITTGGAYCWGLNSSGQLAATTGSLARDSIAALTRGNLTFQRVTAGGSHSCGITTANDAYCWGANGSGQLGDGSFTSTGVNGDPVLVAGGLKFATIDAGANHTCGITTASGTAAIDRQVYCWGYNGSGQLGNGNTGTNSNVPVRVSEPLQSTTRAASVSLGELHTCVVALNSNAYCWGYDGLGQLGDDGLAGDRNVPTIVAGGLTFLAITAGAYHTCGIVSLPPDTPGRCWGYNYYGQLGDNTPLTGGGSGVNQFTPVALFGNLNFSTINAGNFFTCAIAVGGTGYCWGQNNVGQLGDDLLGTNTSQRSAIAGSLTFLSIQAGGSHACGRTASAIYCWGSNSSGQGGTPGVGVNKRVPVQIVQ